MSQTITLRDTKRGTGFTCTCDLTSPQNCPQHMDKMMAPGIVVKNYVVGFLFDRFYNSVVLIEKNKPEWQKGKLNGVGGKIEYGESPLAAMIREFREEATLTITGWREFAKIRGEGYNLHCFTATYAWDLEDAKEKTDEPIYVCTVKGLRPDRFVSTNLTWLIPMAMDTNPYLADVHDQKEWS